jgi:hypothetical protein
MPEAAEEGTEPPPEKKRRKSYEDKCPSKQYQQIREEVKKIEKEPMFEDALKDRLVKRAKVKASDELKDPATGEFFDSKLSCFNAIQICNLSLNGWDEMRCWIRDFDAKGGDLLRLPCAATLREYRPQLVPSGLLVTATTARVPIQSVLEHTANQMAKRPDVSDKMDELQDGAVVEMVWKAGMDGQSGWLFFVSSI